MPDLGAHVLRWSLIVGNLGRFLPLLLATLTHDGGLLRVEIKPDFHHVSDVV
jgi:hypothetical protein